MVGPLSCDSHIKEEVDEAGSRIRARISIRPPGKEQESEREGVREKENAGSSAREPRGAGREREKRKGGERISTFFHATAIYYVLQMRCRLICNAYIRTVDSSSNSKYLLIFN